MFKPLTLIIALLFWLSPNAKAQDNSAHQHSLVTMRLIGHEILLSSGDSLSRILPIKEEDGKFKIAFENEFSVNPEDLVAIINTSIEEKRVASHYLVELEQEETQEIVYSYEMGNSDTSTVVSCNARTLPTDSYNLYITIFTPYNAMNSTQAGIDNTPKLSETSNWQMIAIVLLLALIPGAYLFFKKRTRELTDPDTISIGAYRFNKRNMELSFEDKKTDLTGKEAELLNLLYASANNTVEHETILKAVWDDDGDYIGRTLDVFISKLRKKLNADKNIKIVNVRGVGYRLVLNGN